MTAEFPVLPFRTTLYTPAELFDGFRSDDPTSYAATLDLAAYRSTRLGPNREVGMLRALHDQCVTEARDAFLAGRRVVAVMGGHAMARTDTAYRQVPAFLLSGTHPRPMECTWRRPTKTSLAPRDRTSDQVRARWSSARKGPMRLRPPRHVRSTTCPVHSWRR